MSMQIDDCTATTVINGVNYCVLVIHQQSWLDELNNLTVVQVGLLLSSTALIWYVAWGIRAALDLLGHDHED
ncbi:hypothetical protein [Acinetobacter nosocomialis]|nr:hypothetical protein [Acinetobacter nosocomialis]